MHRHWRQHHDHAAALGRSGYRRANRVSRPDSRIVRLEPTLLAFERAKPRAWKQTSEGSGRFILMRIARDDVTISLTWERRPDRRPTPRPFCVPADMRRGYALRIDAAVRPEHRSRHRHQDAFPRSGRSACEDPSDLHPEIRDQPDGADDACPLAGRTARGGYALCRRVGAMADIRRAVQESLQMDIKDALVPSDVQTRPA
ncbi:hypothetical protein [Paracoccus spongiarum]|uniref:Uncharacterized protein n=1 Tax=Paracoccus spongiarum TaxID=3064387 RepID=A0ABT9J9W9_9RHOB|nr:hypothetical protein [Paracoccus sp. 2205BS29-5]MDP5306439.1 hypothetical protein [Paracoccus sp. 2205BS29-5]